MRQISVIILSHSFPPENNISGRRAHLMASRLSDSGFNVTVITSDTTERAKSKKEKYSVVGIESYNYKNEKRRFFKSLLYLYARTSKSELINKIVRNILFFFLPIDFDIKFHIPDGYEKEFADTDYIIGTGPPWYIFGEACVLSKKLNAKLILDYRDSWMQLDKSKIKDVNYYGKLHRLKKIKFRRLEKKWLMEAYLITGASEHIINNIKIVPERNKTAILNGYHHDAEKNYSFEIDSKTSLKITYTGKLYSEQISHLDLFLKAVDKLNTQNKISNNFVVQLIGVRDSKFGLVQSVLDKYSRLGQKIITTDRLDSKEVLKIQLESDIFINFSYKNSPKVYGTKIFEYIAFPHPILHITSDQNDYISQVIRDTDSGYVCEQIEDIEKTIVKLFNQFSEGHWEKIGKLEKVKKYSFDNQIQKLITYLK